MFNKRNRYFEEMNGNKYLTLVPTNESKGKIKRYEDLRIKIKDLTRSVTKKSDNYDQKYMKIKFNSDGELPHRKMIEISVTIIVVRPTFYENSKYYPEVFFDEILYKI